MKTQTTITKDMTIEEILSSFPQKAQKIAQEITKAGLQCVGCHAATYETLEVGMLGHGMKQEQVDSLLYKLNKILDEKQDLSTITLTPKAAKKYLEILEEEGKQGWGLRFEEQMAGCSGFEYILDYSEKAELDDAVFHSQGIEIHVKKALLPRLIGSEIDFIDSLMNAGFKISNPNVSASCGCGSSHGY
jgi:iron-sulfur cluster assembly accessory protein